MENEKDLPLLKECASWPSVYSAPHPRLPSGKLFAVSVAEDIDDPEDNWSDV